MMIPRFYISSVAMFFLLAVVSTIGWAQDSLWAVNFGGIYNDEGNSCLRLANGDMVIIGSTYSYGSGEHDIYLVKTDSTGGIIWQKTFGGANVEYGFDIAQSYDNGYILVGSTNSSGAGKKDIYLIKTNSSGIEQWARTYGGSENDVGYSVRQTYDSGLIICGTTSSYGLNTDIYIIKTDSAGDSLWTKTYGGSSGESGAAIRETSDRGFAIVGNTGSFGVGYSSVYFVRADSLGDTLWTSSYGNDRADVGITVETTNDKGYILGGATVEDGEYYYDAYMVKLDSLGLVEWDSAYGNAYDDRIYSIQTTADGGYIAGGSTEGSGSRKIDLFSIKIDAVGAVEWSGAYGGRQSDFCKAIIKDTDNNYYAMGYSYSATNGGSDIYILKIQGNGPTAVDDPWASANNMNYELNQNYPNPFNLLTTIEYSLPRVSDVSLSIYNILGQVIKRWEYGFQPAGMYSIPWDGRNESGNTVASGVYIYQLQTTNYSQAKRMVLLK